MVSHESVKRVGVTTIGNIPENEWLCVGEADGLIPPGCTCISTPQQYNITVTVTIPQNCITSDGDSSATVFFYNGFGGKPIVTSLLHFFEAIFALIHLCSNVKTPSTCQ